VGDSATIRDLLADPSFSLQHDPIVTKLPVFLSAAGPNNQELYSSNPIDSPDLNALLKAACREVGLQCRVCMYVWRREFLAEQGTHQTMLQDDMLIIHATITGIVRLRTIMTMVLVIKIQDITALRLGENLESSGALRNRIRELLDSSAIHRRSQYPFAEGDEHVSSHWHLTTRIKRSVSL
jgi:hypothetical protein